MHNIIYFEIKIKGQFHLTSIGKFHKNAIINKLFRVGASINNIEILLKFIVCALHTSP